MLEAPEPGRVEFQPDQEEQQDDAEIGNVEHVLGACHQPQPIGADQRARTQIAQHRAETEAAEQADEDHCRSEDDDAVAQHHRGGLGGMFGHQPPARSTASAAASKASRIDLCRAL